MGAITRYRGDNKSIVATISDKAGNIVPVSGCSLILTIDPEENPIDPSKNVLKKTGVIVGDGSTGQFKFSFTEEEVDFVGDFFFDLEFSNTAGEKDTLEKNNWYMVQDIGK